MPRYGPRLVVDYEGDLVPETPRWVTHLADRAVGGRFVLRWDAPAAAGATVDIELRTARRWTPVVSGVPADAGEHLDEGVGDGVDDDRGLLVDADDVVVERGAGDNRSGRSFDVGGLVDDGGRISGSCGDGPLRRLLSFPHDPRAAGDEEDANVGVLHEPARAVDGRLGHVVIAECAGHVLGAVVLVDGRVVRVLSGVARLQLVAGLGAHDADRFDAVLFEFCNEPSDIRLPGH